LNSKLNWRKSGERKRSMAEPITHLDRLVFGQNCQRCPLSEIIWENGIGSASREIQTMRALEKQPAFRAELEVLHKAELQGFNP
jgi:hypothetical protein